MSVRSLYKSLMHHVPIVKVETFPYFLVVENYFAVLQLGIAFIWLMVVCLSSRPTRVGKFHFSVLYLKRFVTEGKYIFE